MLSIAVVAAAVAAAVAAVVAAAVAVAAAFLVTLLIPVGAVVASRLVVAVAVVVAVAALALAAALPVCWLPPVRWLPPVLLLWLPPVLWHCLWLVSAAAGSQPSVGTLQLLPLTVSLATSESAHTSTITTTPPETVHDLLCISQLVFEFCQACILLRIFVLWLGSSGSYSC